MFNAAIWGVLLGMKNCIIGVIGPAVLEIIHS